MIIIIPFQKLDLVIHYDTYCIQKYLSFQILVLPITFRLKHLQWITNYACYADHIYVIFIYPDRMSCDLFDRIDSANKGFLTRSELSDYVMQV